MVPSSGSICCAFESALAETTIGLQEAKAIRDESSFGNGPLRSRANLEEVTSAAVHWRNTRRLMRRRGRIPPAEAEAAYNVANKHPPNGMSTCKTRGHQTRGASPKGSAKR